MIKIEIIRNESNTKNICKTYSTEGFKLRQIETGIVYGSSVVDVIVGYNEDGSCICKYTYEETDELEEVTEDSNLYEIEQDGDI